MQQYHNVSVRLSETEYKQLTELHDKFNRMSYGKVSLADVLRLAVKELYIAETNADHAKTSEKEKEDTIQPAETKQPEKANKQVNK
jgi:hypothetical protein